MALDALRTVGRFVEWLDDHRPSFDPDAAVGKQVRDQYGLQEGAVQADLVARNLSPMIRAIFDEIRRRWRLEIDAYESGTTSIPSSYTTIDLDTVRVADDPFSLSSGEITVDEGARYAIAGNAAFEAPQGGGTRSVRLKLQTQRPGKSWNDVDGTISQCSWSGAEGGNASISRAIVELRAGAKVRARARQETTSSSTSTVAGSSNLTVVRLHP